MEVDSPDNGRVNGIAMDFPASDGATSCSPPRIPPRLRRRLSDSKTTSPSSVEEIEAKLRDADIRRQKFYENLSSKARLKPRSPSQSSSHEEDLGQRLEAKLQAAEQKRLSILAKAQIRLAKLDELRQAAKTAVEMRCKKERAELVTKVESRVQQAEANRMLILRARRQHRATLKERTSQSLLRRMARESKYKERVRAAICEKRAAAEKNRLGFLEAEKKRAHARFLQVQKAAKSVSHQREVERSKMKDKLEDRLQRAKRQRAEYLMQRQRQNSSACVNWNKMYVPANLLSRKLARCWRQFLRRKKTTFDLAKDYDALNISERHVKSMPFEQLALCIESVATIQTTKALLDRLELRYKLSPTVTAALSHSSWSDIDHLLKRVVSPNRRATPKKFTRSRDAKKALPIREAVKTPVKLSRYQVRVVLCAYMIVSQPDAVFNGQGELEIALAKSAEKFVQEFRLLIKIILDGPIQSSDGESDPALSRHWTFRSQLAAFDAAWCSYLNKFVIWKVKDAQLLEKDLVRAACQLEISMIQTCKLTPEGGSGSLTHDMKAVQKQVMEDQKLLRDKVQHLSGDAGIQRMESALSDTRTKYFWARESSSPIGSPITPTFSPSMSGSSACPSPVASLERRNDMTEGGDRTSHVVRSLFKDDTSSQCKEVGFVAPGGCIDSQLQYYDDNLEMENELIVNEFVHGQHQTFAESFNVAVEDQNGIKAKVRETLENAFWDGVMESMKQDKPKHDRVVELMREVRDGLCEMAPRSWKKEIVEVIDLEILSQLMNSGQLDMDYLQRILEFALVTLRKLSSAANENELKVAHQKFLEELHEISQPGQQVNALIRGLRFVLEQIQALKQEISKARIRMLEPFLKGAAGLEYLEKAFLKHYGRPSDALTTLPLTKQWLESVRESKHQDWNEHKNGLSELSRNQERAAKWHFPSTPLRSGGCFSVKMSGNQVASATIITGAVDRHLECKGEKIDLLVRLGLLKLVVRISGLTQDGLPETMKLNLFRLRAVQAQIQKIVVIATSILVLRQTLLSEQLVASPTDLVDGMGKDCIKQLAVLLDTNEDAGVKEIIEILGKVVKDYDKSVDAVKFQTRIDIMSGMLSKSLQAGDAVFIRVSHAVYVAARGVALGGSGACGRELTEMALRQVGAAALTDRVVEAASVLAEAATVSLLVHAPWYAHLIEKM